MTATHKSFGLITLIAAVIIGGWLVNRFLPLGLPEAELYFKALGERQLQADEIGQRNSVEHTFYSLSLHGDEFKGWDTEHQHFWKYSIAFSAYGIPSLILIDPDNKARYQSMMDTMIWKMKSKRVWGDFTDWGFGADPVSVQNIMYKGHLNLMYGLYQLSTNDKRYEREYTWLTKKIADEMRLHHQGKYEGVTCEPNAWFVECNAISMLSLHVYDQLYQTNYTENEVQWSLDFILGRMRDPESGLFYRAYLPNHDLVKEQISGYANAWIFSILAPFANAELADGYPNFKARLVEQFGPYAGVKEFDSGEPNQVAQIFGLWAAKEQGDVKLFAKLRNAVDKIGELKTESVSDGLAYNDPNSVLINGVILSSKVHLGWGTILNYPWPSKQDKNPIPDVSGMDWTQILPQRVFTMGASSTLPEANPNRPCPSCFWGSYKSVRMLKEQESSNTQCGTQGNTSCALKTGDTQLLESL